MELILGLYNDIAAMENSLVVPQKAKHRIIYDLINPILGIYQKGLKTSIQTKTSKWMFIAALLLIIKRWKQPKYSSVDEWLNKMSFIHTMNITGPYEGMKY